MADTGLIEENEDDSEPSGQLDTKCHQRSGSGFDHFATSGSSPMKYLAAIAFALLAGPLSAQEPVLDKCVYESELYSAGSIVILEDWTRLICQLDDDRYVWVAEMAVPKDRSSN
ncbi:hypothetical protein [uncultured Tateyamaria sp.]|uniref:hypothetical protein n=2 Tax=uncultured Tateyamaria sp. TaxID=455651 RepID=UPI00260A9641|nr:hypothetical protein [uncultured Tateyamaria sp.]